MLARTTWTNSSEGKPGLVVDQSQQYKISKADRIAEGYEFICPIFRQDKISLYRGLEKLSKNSYSI